jgi:hypothetical protein
VKALIACLKASQLDADAVKPNTIAVARLYNSSAMKPKAPVKSAWILGYLKHTLTSARPRYRCSRITDVRVVDVCVDLAFDMAKRHWCFLGDWCDLIHDYICQSGDCQSFPYNVIVLSILYDNTLHSMT